MNWFSDQILERISVRRNQNFLACWTGQTGSGKTYGAMAHAEWQSERIGVPFNIDNVVFSFKELMDLINSGKLMRGSHIVYEEAGVTYNSREWQSMSNKLLNYLMQTFRHRNYVMYFTMPDFDFVDKTARKLFHCRFETNEINYRRKIVYVKPLMLDVAQGYGKQYNRYMRFDVKGRLTGVPVKRLGIRLPTKGLVDDYEAKKKCFTDQLNEQIVSGLSGADFRLTLGKKETEQLLNELRDNVKPRSEAERLRGLRARQKIIAFAESLVQRA